MKIPFTKEWVILEREDYANYLFVVNTWEGFTILPKHWGFAPARWLSAEYINSATNLFVTLDGYNEASRNYFASIFTRPELWERLHRDTKRYASELLKVSRQITRLPLRQLGNSELLEWRLRFEKPHLQMHDRRGPMFFIEVRDNLLTNYLHDYLATRARDLKITQPAPFLAFQILTTPLPKSLITVEKEKLIKIAFLNDSIKQKQALANHAKEFGWLEYGLQGKILPLEHFQRELASIKRRGPQKLLQKMRRDKLDLARKQKEVRERYYIHDQHRAIFKIARDAIFYKGYSKDVQFCGYYRIEGLLREIGRRLGLTLEQVRFLTLADYKAGLLRGRDLSTLANERRKYSLHFSDKGRTLYFVGKRARQIRRRLKFVTTTHSVKIGGVIKGQPAFAGRAQGKVKIINTPQEMLKMHQGDILVSHMTNPDIVPAMKKAAAIVTDLGGITCHAAIVSRELKKPCIIGTKIVTQVLKDGDKVEVDANKGIVKKL